MIFGERPLRQPSAELLGQCDDDALGAADVTEPTAALVLRQTADPMPRPRPGSPRPTATALAIRQPTARAVWSTSSTISTSAQKKAPSTNASWAAEGKECHDRGRRQAGWDQVREQRPAKPNHHSGGTVPGSLRWIDPLRMLRERSRHHIKVPDPACRSTRCP